jgi:AcrR family transcriptional regulator
MMPQQSAFLRLRENEREARRSLILETAMELFSRKPIHEIGMRDIAAQAGIAAASIYRYFPSRDDLLMEALIQEVNTSEQLIRARMENGPMTIEDLAVAVCEYLLDHDLTVQMIAHFNAQGEASPESLERYNAAQRSFFSSFDQAVTGRGGKETIRFVSHAFFAAMVGIVIIFRNYPGRSQDEIRKHIERLARITASAFKHETA